MVTKAVENSLPPLFKRHVRRPRLTRILDASTAQTILIIGPAGYGKTTLVAEWLQGRDDGIWYRATPASADVATFSTDLVEVIQPVVPGAGARVRDRIRVPEAPERLARILAELLTEDIHAWPRDKWLVVDDYHFMAESKAVEAFVDWLLTLSSIRLVVTSRVRPIWASARRILYHQLTELTREQLAMTNDEAGAALPDVRGDTLASFVGRADGWPALIGLASLSSAELLPTDRLSATLFNYFAEEVLRQQPARLQQAMLVASVLPHLTEEAASEVLELPDPKTSITELLEVGLLQEAGEQRHSLHPLLREFLQQKLSDEQSSLKTELERRAIEYFRNRRLWDNAFQLSIDTGQLKLAAEVVGEAADDLLRQGRSETLDRWLHACGPALLRSPNAQLARVDLMMRRGHFTEGQSAALHVLDIVPDDHPLKPRAAATAAHAAYWLSLNDDALKHSQHALRLATTPDDRRRALWAAYLASQALEKISAPSYLDQLETILGDDVDYRLRLAVGRALALARSGTCAGVWPALEALLPYLEWSSDPMVRSNFLVHCAFANLALCRYDTAARYATEALDLCRVLRLEFAIATCLAFKFEVELGRRNTRAARSALTELRTNTARSPDLYSHVLLARSTVRWALFHGNYPTDVYHLDRSWDLLEPSFAGELYAVHALGKASQGELLQAEEFASEALELCKAVETVFLARFARLIVRLRSGEPDRGETERLLKDASDAAYLDCFVAAYRSYPPLLAAAACGKQQDLVHDIVAAAHDRSFAARNGISLPVASQAELLFGVLTRRETEVVELMDRGLSNREIAERLFISHHTAKVHVHNISRKLGARTRLQAITRYRTLSTDAG